MRQEMRENIKDYVRKLVLPSWEPKSYILHERMFEVPEPLLNHTMGGIKT